MSGPLKLYGTQCCHLCDEAKALLHAAGVEFDYVDIVDDDALLEPYGMRIPVIQRTDTNAELGWPFDDAQVEKLMQIS